MKLRTYRRRGIAALLVCALALQLTGCAASGRLTSAVPSSAVTQASSRVPSSSSAAESSPSSSSALLNSSSASSASSSVRKQTASVKSEVKIPLQVSETKKSQTVERKSVQKRAFSSGGYSTVAQTGGYQSLKTDAERTLYQMIGDSVYQVAVSKTEQGYAPTGQIAVPGKLTEAQIRLVTTAYLDDHPEVFWIANAYSYGYRNNQTILQLYSELTQSECNTALLAFNGKIQSIVQSIPSGLSEFDREEYLFDYITNACTYDSAAVNDSSDWKAFTAYGTLMDGKSVCEGYSRAMLLLCGYAGLSTVLIRGTGSGVGHMWNGIKIDGNWYHIDLTWCDSTKLIYNYFNIDDQTIKLTHVIAPAASSLTDAQICGDSSIYNLTLPVCSSMKENYFIEKGIVISTLNDSGDSAVVSAIAAEMKSKKATLAFRIASGDYDGTVKGLTSASPFKMAAYLQKGAAAAGVSLNPKDISYVTDQSDSGLNVFVSYQ
ncbi:hypothetical protein EQM14_02180 [Caproiciproducens sp. NJN-50]|uniref:transglutaminase domain-containing protein n=1 Tax=Caproiciproducens sp. NJN-50 TaxID=2507162 RepID=UPI000FFE16C2|nr:transglutaminase domain-containing protein [Caproiciproducens sp. NJN-50]QAT48680.1 hypothetical protein EQM14_02180 [Caproiciproducens sp. NJN-50]